MVSSWLIRFHDTKLKRSLTRGQLARLFCFQVFLAIVYNKYFLIWRQYYQRRFSVEEWKVNQVIACNGNFIGFGNQFLWLKYVKLNTNNMAFGLPCDGELPRYWFDRMEQGTPYTSWLSYIEARETGDYGKTMDNDFETQAITFAVRRVEAHNLYHTICEVYNIFLVHKLLEIEWKSINILFMDSRPPSKMDEIWIGLFDIVTHHEEIEESRIFKNLIWIPIGYESPINRHYLQSLPFASEFQELFIKSFGINKSKGITCKSVNYTLILRHDYISHPERAKLFQGKVHRKLANETNVIQAIKSVIGPRDTLRTVLLETLSMREQLEIFANTDILIAVHGAGMTHIMNLPDHAFVLELRPFKFDTLLGNPAYHFRALSRWRGLNYMYLRSDNKNDDIYSYEINIPIEDLSRQMQIIKCHIDRHCGDLDTHCTALEVP